MAVHVADEWLDGDGRAEGEGLQYRLSHAELRVAEAMNALSQVHAQIDAVEARPGMYKGV